jgi:DNA polymerase II large subunit
LWHAAKRRDCDGDEDSISLALDVLLNFSKAFLPGRIGGMMDAPLLLTLGINPVEVARQAFNVEVVEVFPLAFFEEAERHADPKRVSDLIETLSHRVGTEGELQPLAFTHEVENLNSCNKESSYKKLESMSEKVQEQLGLAELVKAVDAREVARRLLSTHFMRDLTGNLKAFSTQRLRCTRCNTRYRRVPLSGKCQKCGGKISLTVHKGSIEKYLEIAERLVSRYNIGEYHEQRLKLIRDEIASLFEKTNEKDQMLLGDFA